MGVDLKKVEAEAPHLVDLTKKTQQVLLDKKLNPEQYKANVVGTFDNSGSTEMGRNHLYSEGKMQEVADIAFAAGLVFDDDGQVPMSVFNSNVRDLGEMSLQNCKGFLSSVRAGGGTDYVAALRWIIGAAGFGGVDLGVHSGKKRGLFGKGNSDALTVKATAPYPTYALFVTDGEPGNPHEEIESLLTAMSQLPIFVQFVGVGEATFSFLQRLDDLDGRLIDNADFFDAKDANHDQTRMLELMLNEFPGYYANAKRNGLIQ